MYISLLMLVLAVSMDSFGVGITYGIRKITFTWSSIVILSLCSGMVMFISMKLGQFMSGLIKPEQASCIGGVILIVLGCHTLLQSIRRKDIVSKAHKNKKRWTMVVNMRSTPSIADIDRSGIITAGEATLLGIALSLDAFGVGIGASMLLLPPLMTACLTACSCICFIGAGLFVGRKLNGRNRLELVPGLILIVMGIWKGFL